MPNPKQTAAITAPVDTPQERTGGFGFYYLLGLPIFYRWSQQLAWSAHGSRVVMDFAAPVAGESVFDIGCGPGDRLPILPDVQYTGFDLNADYITAAIRRHGSRARFFRGDVASVNLDAHHGTYDLVLAHGVLHHVDDARAARLFSLAYDLLKPGGRLVTIDPCYATGQSKAARWFVGRDRGQFVRDTGHYLRLASTRFGKITSVVRHDLLRIPYSFVLVRSEKKR